MLPPDGQIDPNVQPVILGLLPFYHAYGLIGILQIGLLMGAKIVVMDKFKPRRFLSAIEKYKVIT